MSEDKDEENESRSKRIRVDDEQEDEKEETEENIEGEKNEEEQAEILPVVEDDPRAQLIAELAKEFEDEEDKEFAVVIGPTLTETSSSSDALQNSQRKPGETLPAFRFSGSSLTASLNQPLLPEVEEAMRVTGVNSSNYPFKINNGRVQRRKNALEDNLDEIEPAKWRDPGAVQSDFFNFGLNEHTWREYAARQVALRLFRLQKMEASKGGGVNTLDSTMDDELTDQIPDTF